VRTATEQQVPPLRYAPVGMTILLREMAPRAVRQLHVNGPTELSSRPERSAVEGPAVLFRSQTSAIGFFTMNQYDSAPREVASAQIINAIWKEWVWSSSHPVMIGASDAQIKLPKF
jgi:hypothetical protein